MKRNTYQYKIAMTLAKVGACYTNDLVEYMISQNKCSRRTDARYTIQLNLKVMDDLLEYSTVDKLSGYNKNKAQLEFVSLSQKGRVALLDLMSDDQYELYKSELSQTPKEFRTSDPQALARNLSESRVKLYCQASEIAYHKFEKPCLYHLYHKQLTRFPDNPYRAELDSTPDFGFYDLTFPVYYSHKEYCDFIAQINGGKPKDFDNINGSRFRGIIFTSTNFFVVYQATLFEHDLIKLNDTNEERLMDSLTVLTSKLHIKREVPTLLNKITKSDAHVYSGKKYYNDISAIILCEDASDAAYHSLGVHTGKVVRSDNKHATCLSGMKKFKYDHLYAIAFTQDGFRQLSYIAHTTIEQYHQESINLLKGREGFFVFEDERNFEPLFPAVYSVNHIRHKVLYLPAFELSMLARIATDTREGYTLIIHPDMLDAVSHCLRNKECYLFNVEDFSCYTFKDYLFYDELGYIAGCQYLKKELIKKGKDVNKTVVYKLPQLYKVTFAEFYNSVYKRSPSDETITKMASFCPDYVRSEKVKKHVMKKRFAFDISYDVAKDVIRIAYKKKMTWASYIKNAVYKQLQLDLAEEKKGEENGK